MPPINNNGSFAEPTNADRAFWAQESLEPFAVQTMHRTFSQLLDEAEPGDGSDAACCASDLICDILHFCHQQGWDTASIQRQAVSNFEIEVEEEDDEV